MRRPVETFLTALERMPAVTVDTNDGSGSASVRVGSQAVAHVNLRHARVVVNEPADRIPVLQRMFPTSRPAADGLVFELADARGSSEALAAVRRRVIVERSIPQLRLSSP